MASQEVHIHVLGFSKLISFSLLIHSLYLSFGPVLWFLQNLKLVSLSFYLRLFCYFFIQQNKNPLKGNTGFLITVSLFSPLALSFQIYHCISYCQYWYLVFCFCFFVPPFFRHLHTLPLPYSASLLLFLCNRFCVVSTQMMAM